MVSGANSGQRGRALRRLGDARCPGEHAEECARSVRCAWRSSPDDVGGACVAFACAGLLRDGASDFAARAQRTERRSRSAIRALVVAPAAPARCPGLAGGRARVGAAASAGVSDTVPVGRNRRTAVSVLARRAGLRRTTLAEVAVRKHAGRRDGKVDSAVGGGTGLPAAARRRRLVRRRSGGPATMAVVAGAHRAAGGGSAKTDLLPDRSPGRWLGFAACRRSVRQRLLKRACASRSVHRLRSATAPRDRP